MDCFNLIKRRCSCINFKWLPIKAHYFLMFGAVAGVTPFLTILGKSLGLDSTAVGITYTVLPISIFVFKPLFGFIADYIQNTKVLVICLLSAKVVLSLFILLLEPIKNTKLNETCIEAQMHCKNIHQETEKVLFYFSQPCLENSYFVNNVVSCNISLNHQTLYNNSHPSNSISTLAVVFDDNDTNVKHCSENSKCKTISALDFNCWILLSNDSFPENNRSCAENRSTENLSLTCDNNFESCLNNNNNFRSEENVKFYQTYQFWTYMLLIVTSCLAITSAMSLTDVSCYEMLREQTEYYGRQRLFGTASTGIITLFSGFFNDIISNENEHTEYLAGFYVMVALSFLNLVLLIKMDLPKVDMSTSIVSDVRSLCRSKEFVTFSVAVFFIGTLASLNSNYLFWYLTDLGASQSLLGLAVTVQCLVAEVPFFFFSGWFIKHLGYFNCLTCSFVGFALRFGMYYLLQNPWFVLPVETLHGLTYAVFYASCTSYASAYAPPGTEATILGLLCGIYEGLGFAIGSLLGGLSFNKYGGNQTFLAASCLSTLCVPATFISHFIFKRSEYKGVTTSESEKVKTMNPAGNEC